MNSSSIAAEDIIRAAFPGIPQREAEELVAIGSVSSYPVGKVLCRENAIEETFFVILEGQVEVSKTINENEERLLKTLHQGDFFGEMGLIHNAPRGATVTTISQVEVLEINKSSFDKLLEGSSSMSLAMVHEVSRRLRENDEMAIEDLRLKAGELAAAYQRLAKEELARREFLTIIAHELRTPLTAARGFLEMARFHDLEEADLKDVLSTVGRNVEQIVTLVNDILFLQEVEIVMPEMHPTEIGELVEYAVNKMEGQAAAAGVEFVVEVEPNVPLVAGHVRSIQRALVQLLDNAVKFSPGGGAVNIRVAHDDDGAKISIRDHGIGIDEKVLPHIFDRFFHMDKIGSDVFGGLGLGLSITKQVIEQHNGRIEVESIFGEGSTFTIYLCKSHPDEVS
ncbi:MAG: cyclic nucleotide-binding domain-containing protein [Anaerolineales bacterium]|nr:cyclic nucleotide-binding domain-containing protein [Chloroflexota bacterium]MBL6982065.1 cyclic nucleotide-binding domain-containing protein [Anaerolineales bacterium]